jgi:hypothetical protein
MIYFFVSQGVSCSPWAVHFSWVLVVVRFFLSIFFSSHHKSYLCNYVTLLYFLKDVWNYFSLYSQIPTKQVQILVILLQKNKKFYELYVYCKTASLLEEGQTYLFLLRQRFKILNWVLRAGAMEKQKQSY